MREVKQKPQVPKVLEHALPDCQAVAEAVKAVGDAALRVCNGPLSMRAVCLLVRDNLPRGVKSRLSTSDVQDVLEAAAALGSYTVKPKKVTP